MADAPKDSDQSMEDILQSIKRIIADEGDTPAPAPASTLDSDVLELTELLAEDVAVPAAETSVAAPLSLDEIMGSFEPAPAAPAVPEPVIVPTPPAPAPAPVAPEPVIAAVAPPMAMPVTPTPVEVPAPAPAHTPVQAAHAPTPAPAAPAPSSDGLISDTTLAASMAALHSLLPSPHANHTSPSPVFRSGATIEDLALEAIRPVVKEWLDTNLPALVRQMVEREIRRIRVE